MTNYVKEYMGHKVPEGATHAKEFVAGHIEFYKSGFYFREADQSWRRQTRVENFHESVELPQEPESKEWVDGLPPIGCECEIKYFHDDESKWGKCYVVGETKDNKCLVINVYHDCSLHFAFKKNGSLEFRPLKTEKEKDREAFIEWGKKGLSYRLEEQSFAIRILEQLADNGAKAPKGE